MHWQPFKLISQAVLITALLVGMSAGAGPADPAIEAEMAALVATAKPAFAAAGTAPTTAEQARVTWSGDGFVRFLGAPAAQHFPGNGATTGQPELTARRFLQQHARLFGVNSPAMDWQVIKHKSQRGRHYVRFQQHYAGLPVFAAQVTVQLDAQDGVEAVFSDIERDTQSLDGQAVSLAPVLTAEQVAARARSAKTAEALGVILATTPPKLCLFSPSVVGSAGTVRLAWELDVRSTAGPLLHRRVLVDAHGGAVVYEYPLNHSALVRHIYDCTNSFSYDFVHPSRSENDPPVLVADVNFAYDYLADVYNFYLVEHGRDGMNSWTPPFTAFVRYCKSLSPAVCPWSNAEYDTGWLYFGQGWATDDVVAHEYTHGVTGAESSLIYRNASGAINESFSDIWGEFVDLTNGRGNDGPAVRWDVGEDLPNGRIRSMSNPTVFSHPDRLTSQFYVPPPATPSAENDWGGVHSNSGVNNKLCSLLTDGGTFNASTVTALGISRIADLYYEANANLLQSGADWTDLYNALRQAAINLGWTTAEQSNLYVACRAVEIAPPSDLYVDKTSVCLFQAGLSSCITNYGPYLSVRQGMTNALAGDTLHIQSGNYNETLTFSNRLTLRPNNGPTSIGKP